LRVDQMCSTRQMVFRAVALLFSDPALLQLLCVPCS
jgi:hypothetical protein